MSNQIEVRKYIEDIFKTNRLAVLATAGEVQPHASLISITPTEGYRKLIFATYRNTRKYQNLVYNDKVAVLIESADVSRSGQQESFVLTAFGHVEAMEAKENKIVFNTHLERHPELLSFMQSEDCSLILIKVDSYQVVRGIDDVEWWTIDDLDAPSIG